MLVELSLVEQRYQAVLEVLTDGAPVTDMARRYGVARQTVHDWLRKYAAAGLRGLADRSARAAQVDRADAAIERFKLAAPRPRRAETTEPEVPDAKTPVTTRRVSGKGTISFAAASYKAGVWLAGQEVCVVCEGGRATPSRACSSPPTPGATPSTSRRQGSSGAGGSYRSEDDDDGVGHAQGRLVRQRVLRRHQLPGRLQVPASPAPGRRVGDTVEISVGNELIRSHKVKHDRTREHAPSPTPADDPTGSTPPEGSRCQAATGVQVSCGYRGLTGCRVRAKERVDALRRAHDVH